MIHPNSDASEALHHLYEIVDRANGEVFKYGISSDEISPQDGMSRRMRTQIRLLNQVDNWDRFLARVLVREIPGRRKAKRLEREHISAFQDEHGRKPRGNLQD